MMKYGEVERFTDEAVEILFKVMSWYSLGGTEENCENNQYIWCSE
jgi:hypothetical protein